MLTVTLPAWAAGARCATQAMVFGELKTLLMLVTPEPVSVEPKMMELVTTGGGVGLATGGAVGVARGALEPPPQPPRANSSAVETTPTGAIRPIEATVRLRFTAMITLLLALA